MLVGLTTIGSAAQRVASSPSAGLTFLADSSGPTWAVAVAVRASKAATAAPAASPRRGRGGGGPGAGRGAVGHRWRLLVGWRTPPQRRRAGRFDGAIVSRRVATVQTLAPPAPAPRPVRQRTSQRGRRGVAASPFQYFAESIGSPPLRVPRAVQTAGSTLDLTNRTEPSARARWTPPGW